MFPFDVGVEGWALFTTKAERQKRKFSQLLVESICESVPFAEWILNFIEMTTPIRRDEIAENPELFAKELEKLLGEGARIVNREIVENLYDKLGIELDEIDDQDLPRYIRYASSIYLKRAEKGETR